MHPHLPHIAHLCHLLLQLYCPHILKQSGNPASINKLQAHLVFAIAEHMGIEYDLMPGIKTFYRHYCQQQTGSAMCEKLAVFYYAITEPHTIPKLVKYYHTIGNLQRLTYRPYFDRFVREHPDVPAPPPPAYTLSEPFEKDLIKWSTKKIEALEQAVIIVKQKKLEKKMKRKAKKAINVNTKLISGN